MKKDWLGVFLPLWAVCTIAWVAGGFMLVPSAFRMPLITDHGQVWQDSSYDFSNIDWVVARQLAMIVLPPIVVVIVAMVTATRQERRRRREQPEIQ
jgi:hypothetical protein